MRKADPRSFVGMLWLVISILVAIGQCFAEKGINDALIDAATRGDLSDVNTALDKGADVNARDKFGRTPLHWAAYKGHVEAMKSLLSRGADIDSQRMEESHVPRHPISIGPLSTPLYSAILNK
ncbi:MAG: ankyrin repeat domain-containing protein [Desulfomonile tiedjei]|uniref:Ankyrin repeat domain-containing protein n=1 Tax=Desulfomonile tiedjei TaxID=2358 RepID=A0A9D6V7X7_9BACT|nr:ankyrin repeat domain-containing protein [Desulfomonile tiedjei]